MRNVNIDAPFNDSISKFQASPLVCCQGIIFKENGFCLREFPNDKFHFIDYIFYAAEPVFSSCEDLRINTETAAKRVATTGNQGDHGIKCIGIEIVTYSEMLFVNLADPWKLIQIFNIWTVWIMYYSAI